MLSTLAITDIVLIDKLTLSFADGLCVLTGETGAGKSIILDALGLALGARGDGSLVRPGAKEGSVTAVFEPENARGLEALADANSLDISEGLILRRVQRADGRARAFINDQPVSVQLLREVGAALVEIHGQHDERAFLDISAHRALLDAYGGFDDDLAGVAEAWRAWREARAALEAHEAKLAAARADEAYLRHAVDELDKLGPEPGEEQKLAETRELMRHAEKFADDLGEAEAALSGDHAADLRLNAVLRKLERNREKAAGRFDGVIDALARAVAELAEARAAVGLAQADLEFDPRALDDAEERLFALKAAARKYNVAVDDLPATAADMADKLAAMDHDEAEHVRLKAHMDETQAVYQAAAQSLSDKRRNAADALDRQVIAELGPLKLEKARFVTEITQTSEPGPQGHDQVSFTIAANPGSSPGPLMKTASGGELARVILGLKVTLAERGSAPVLVFDEIDTGAGGAVADAIGARLKQLSGKLQVIAVTHSPQVAAQAHAHWRISKRVSKGTDGKGSQERALTEVEPLDDTTRREEVARMLSGAEVSDEARAAAARLIGAGS